MFTPKTFSSFANEGNLKGAGAITLSLILIGGLALFGTSGSANGQEMIIPIGDIAENCELSWYWDDRTGQLAASLKSAIVITNVTDSSIEGKITSANNNNHTLHVYNDESVVMAQFGYDNEYKGDWQIATKPAGGMFSIDIPAEYADADYVKLWVNSNTFVMQPPQETDSTETSEDESSTEDSATITSTTNSTTTTTTISRTVETDPETNSTIITITTVTEITPDEESDATNSTTITSITTTTIDSTGTATSSTTTTTTTESTSEDSEDPQVSYTIGGNMTISQIAIDAPEGEYWVTEDTTLFFEEGHFRLDSNPMSRYDVEEDDTAMYPEVYQTQIWVIVESAMTTYEFESSG
jgi:hypothetical protein